MKKKFLFSIFLLLSFFCYDNQVYAFSPNGVVACYEDTTSLSINSSTSGGWIASLSCGQKVEVLETVEVGGNFNYKYRLTDGKNTGYVTGCYIITTKLSEYANNYYNTKENLETYKTSLKASGFPDSYIPYLVEIHARHPNWKFYADNIDLTWSEVINGEDILDNNLVWYEFDDNYRSTKYGYNWVNNTFSRSSTEPSWYNASTRAIEFYMDPRNYLNEKYIFAFEQLGFNAAYHNTDVVESVLGDTFMPSLYNSFYTLDRGDSSSKNYAIDIFNSGKNNNVSPLHMASRIYQEVGSSGSNSSSGATFTYINPNGATLSASGYYNFFNIRATADNYGNNNVTSGLIYAMGDFNKTSTSYGRPWNTPYKSILGGALFISGDYVGIGQDTLYYQKFDVSRSLAHYVHQYQQNITAPASEGGKTYNGYKKVNGLLDKTFVFSIPVYKSMPVSNATSPVLGNPNYYLNSLKVNGTLLNNFAYNNNNYQVSIPVASSTINISATTISGQASVSGTGNITIDSNNKKHDVIVTAGNGDKYTYTINIIREDDPGISINTILDNSSVKYNDKNIYGINPGTNVSSLIANVKKMTNYANIIIKSKDGVEKTNDSFRTGDKVTISSNNETKTYDIIIYGDIDSDGEITKLDYLAVLRHYYGYTSYDGASKVAADVNKDGIIDKLDYLAILRDYYGYAKISQ